MLTVLDDFRAAWRGLRSSPGFSAIATTVLALGLGATIFMYGILDALLIEQPPYDRAERVVWITQSDPAQNDFEDDMYYLDYLEVRSQQRTFQDLAGFYNGTTTISGDGLPERYDGSFVTWNLFDVLRARPVLGRGFTAADDAPNAAPVAMLAHELWRTRFNADPGVIGRTVRINGRPSEVIGVLPPGVDFPARSMLFVPQARDPAKEVRGGQSIGVAAIGRLRDEVSLEDAAADLESIAARLARQYPATNAGKSVRLTSLPAGLLGYEGAQLVYVMFGAVVLVLLVACANVASLVFVRANFRMYESSMRVALGARRPRLIVQLLAESVILSLAGMLVGLALAAIALHAVESAVHSIEDAPLYRFDVDWRVSAFAFGAALFAGLLSGIVPAWRASRPDVMRILRDGGRTGTGLRLSHFTTAMVIVEIALSAALLTGAGLMTKSVLESLHRDIGADISGYMAGRIGLPAANYSEERQTRFAQQALEALAARREIERVTLTNTMPAAGAGDAPVAIEGKRYERRTDYASAFDIRVAPGFFATLDRPILAGRDFDWSDSYEAPPVAIVSEAFVKQHYSGESPLGRRIRMAPESESSKWLTIVGVVPDILHSNDLFQEDQPNVYTPLAQNPTRFISIMAKPRAGAPETLAGVFRDTIRGLDADLPVYFLRTVEEHRRQQRVGIAILANSFAAFAVIAIVLAGVGIYGVLAFTTSQRNREIGVRRALGARDRQVLGAVMRGASIQLAIGLALGIVLSPLMSRAITGALQGGQTDDPTVYGAVFALLVAATLAASWFPARRALKVDPAVALRYE
jgi:predicted permease